MLSYKEKIVPWDKQFDEAKVLDHAMHTFWAHGYEATSVQMLADNTGIDRGSLYACFGDKCALLLDALREYLSRRDRLLAELREMDCARDAIRLAFERLFPRVGDIGISSGCLLVNTAPELAARDEEIGALSPARNKVCKPSLLTGSARVNEPANSEPPWTRIRLRRCCWRHFSGRACWYAASPIPHY